MSAARRTQPKLLIRQLCLLAALCGIFASRYFMPGALALLLLILHQHHRIFRRKAISALSILAALALFFCAGLLYTQWRVPERPEFPAWLSEAVTPNTHYARLDAAQGLYFHRAAGTEMQPELAKPRKSPEPPKLSDVADNTIEDTASSDKNSLFHTGMRVRATVREAQGQPDRNLRLALQDILPLYPTGHGQPLPFAGGLSFTWNSALTPEGAKAPPPGLYSNTDDSAAPAILGRRPLAGDEIELTLRPREIRSLQNPNLWETESYWADNGMWARGWAVGEKPGLYLGEVETRGSALNRLAHSAALWREQLRVKTIQALPKKNGNIANGAELIPALLFGDKYLLDSTDAELFARSTLAHSLALSGLHLGYAAALGYFAVLLLYRLFPALALRLPRQKAAVAAGLVPATLYLWLGGCPPSLLRSFLMLLFAGGLLYLHKPQLLGDALIWAVALILLANPTAAFDLRLQLSAMCIAAMALLLPCLSLIKPEKPTAEKTRNMRTEHKKPKTGKLLRYPLGILAVSSAVQVVLAPLLVKSFGIAGMALPLNLVWLPILGILVMPFAFVGLLATALGLETAAAFMFNCATIPCGWLMQALRYLGDSDLLPVMLPMRPHWLSMLAYWFLIALMPAALAALVSRQRVKDAHGLKLARAVGRPMLSPAHAMGGPGFQPSRAANGTGFKPARAADGFRLKLSCAPRGLLQGHKTMALKVLCGLLLLSAPLLWQHYHDARDVLRLRLLDVGHGQAVLLEWKGGKRLLLDGGGGNSPRFDIGKEVISATLADNRRPSLDFMLASHLDLDHAQGLLFPLKHIPVGYYADNGQEAEKGFAYDIMRQLQARNMARHTLKAGDSLQLEQDLYLEILHPASSGKANNDSLVARLVWRGKGLALLCGDVEKSGQAAILKRLTAQNRSDALTASVLVLPHHGSANALLPEFYQAANPNLALVSTAYGNAWNFPAPQVKNTLREMGIPLLNTARTGQIIIEWSDPRLPPSVSAARTGGLKAWKWGE